MSDDLLKQVADWVAASKSCVAFTGAGISTESGIPDFRSPGGVWATSQPVYFDDFISSESARAEYWRQKSISHDDFLGSEPNAGHQVLAKWEAEGRLTAVITQNIDGLHQQAGNKHVLELHGTAREVSCLSCQFRDDADAWVREYREKQHPPGCPECGGLLKHATISFGQSLPSHVLEESVALSEEADLCFAIGSSLVVEPAASIPRLARESGSRLVIINRDETPQDQTADVVFHQSIGEVLTGIDAHL